MSRPYVPHTFKSVKLDVKTPFQFFKVQPITEVYFIEWFYLYTEVGSSGKGVLTSIKGVTGAIRIVPVCVRRTLQRGLRRALMIGGGYWSR